MKELTLLPRCRCRRLRPKHWLHTGQGGDKYTMFGTYTDDAVRTPDGWKLERVRLRLLREEGNRSPMREAVRRGKQTLTD